MLKALAKEPIDPMLAKEPMEPIENAEPADPMDSTESWERMLQMARFSSIPPFWS